MNVSVMPPDYGSAFREACFVVDNLNAPQGVDVEIRAVGDDNPLGTKRIHAAGTATVNVAPYVRRRLSPTPLCGRGQGFFGDAGRGVSCYIAAEGFSSAAVTLCAGVEAAPLNRLLSASPDAVTIRPGERDELPIISEDWVRPVVSFRRGGTLYTDTSIEGRNAAGIVAVVIDAGAVIASYTRLTGGAADELEEFSVRLVLEQEGYADRVLERHYTVDRESVGGMRLAWVNRYGAVDYHTFGTVDEVRVEGSHTSIETANGMRTAATSAVRRTRLISEPCDARAAEWLAEIFSSPAVWAVEGGTIERVEAEPGETVYSTLTPSVLSFVVSPSALNVSRKL